MRRWHEAAVWEHYIMVTPDMVQIMAGVARNFITNIQIGRSFNMDGQRAASRRGRAALVRRDDRLLGQGHADHVDVEHPGLEGALRVRSSRASCRPSRSTRRTATRSGKFLGLNHEAIFYDPEALVQPIRIVRNYVKTQRPQRRRSVRLHRVRADDLPGQRPVDARVAGQRDPVRSPRHVRPPVGPYWEKYWEKDMAEAAGRGHLHVQVIGARRGLWPRRRSRTCDPLRLRRG